jgi:uncharacterized damage-inducible protein DinB
MRPRTKLLALLFTGAAAVATLQAQVTAGTTHNFREMALYQMKDAEGKVIGLAEAMPAEKYGWRPAPGVRSVSEVYMHIAIANYFILTALGEKMPAGMSFASEKTVTDKAKVVETLKASFANLRRVVTNLPDSDLSKETKYFDLHTTYQGMLFFLSDHLHEHLGQSIAYARTNGVVPPWSGKTGI